MAIRHWHPLKVLLVWGIGGVLAWALWALVIENGCRNCSLPVGTSLLGLLLGTIATVIVITWKWASGRELEGQLKRNAISRRQDGMGKEYRIRTLEISRYDLDHGCELHPGDFAKMDEEFQEWRLLSVCPLEKACNEVDEKAEESVTILALIEHPAVEKHYSGPTLVWRPDPS